MARALAFDVALDEGVHEGFAARVVTDGVERRSPRGAAIGPRPLRQTLEPGVHPVERGPESLPRREAEVEELGVVLRRPPQGASRLDDHIVPGVGVDPLHEIGGTPELCPREGLLLDERVIEVQQHRPHRLRSELRSALGVLGGVLDHRHYPGDHETGRTDGPAGPGHLGDFNRPARVGDLDAPSRASGPDVEALHAVTDVDDDFDPVSLHDLNARAVAASARPAQPRRLSPAGSAPPPQPGRVRAFAWATDPSQRALGLGWRSKVTGSTAQIPSLGPNPRCHSKLSSRLQTK